MEKLAALDDGKARTIQHVADAILHHVFQFTGQNPEMDRVALAAFWSAGAQAGGGGGCVASGDHQLDDAGLMEKLAALDDGKARTIQHVADAILHHVCQFTGQNPEMDRVALAAYGAELVALGNGLSQRIERGHPKRTLEGELRKQAMMGHGKPPCCRDWRRQREVRGTPGHRTAKRPACRTAGEPIYAVNWGDR